MPLAVGQTLSHYEILGLLGAGGMGEVYRARDLSLNRSTAIKLLQQRFAEKAEARERFVDEARITSQLQHPSIPPVHEIGTLEDGRPYLVMKLIRGRTLDELLGDRRSPAEGRGRFLAIFEQVCQAVGYAHANGVIHRDLKPSNVMVGAFGEVQVMDWGLAKVLGEVTPEREGRPQQPDPAMSVIESGRDSSSLTQAGSLLGTPAYMPPEQAKGDIAGTDRRADVFALGAILCELLTGAPAYQAPSSAEVSALALTAQLGPAHDRLDASGAEANLIELCKRCLSADPAARPADAGEIAEAVAAHMAAAEDRLREAELDRVREVERRKRRRVQLILTAAVIGLMVAGGFGATVASLWRRAVRATEVAEAAREELARIEYARTIQVAYDQWRDVDLGTASGLLDDTRPDLRGWEFDYVHRLYNSDLVTGQSGEIDFLDASVDGTRIVTTGEEGEVRVWTLELETGPEAGPSLEGFVLGEGSVGSRRAVVHPDGSRIVTCDLDQAARVWDTASGGLLFTLDAPADDVVGMAMFSPDGARIVTGAADGTVRLWEVEEGRLLHTLVGLTEAVTALSFTADGSRVAAAGGGGQVRVWDVASGELLLALEENGQRVLHASLAPGGSTLATRTSDGTTKLWRWRAEAGRLSLEGQPLVLDSSGGAPWSPVSFSPDGSKLVALGELGAAVWDVRTGEVVCTLDGHRCASSSFSPDGSRILTGGRARDVAVVWDAATGEPLGAFNGHTRGVRFCLFLPDGSTVLTASNDGVMRVWDSRHAPEVRDIAIGGQGRDPRILHTSFAPDGTRIAAGDLPGLSSQVRDARTGDLILDLGEKAGGLASTAVVGGRWLGVMVNVEGLACVWDLDSGREITRLEVGEERPRSASIGPDGSRLVTTSGDVARVWDLETRTEVCALVGHERPLSSASFSPDGSWIVTAGHDGTARIWSLDTQPDGGISARSLLVLDDTGELTCATFSPDGRRIVTSSRDWTARVWTLENEADGVVAVGEPLPLEGHSSYVQSGCFNPDGTRIVTASFDGTVRIWDASTGLQLLTLKGHDHAFSASFSPDGQRIASGGDGVLKMWDAGPLDR